MDFLVSFEEDPDVETLLEMFDAVAESTPAYASDAAAGLAAAEVVAAILGKGSPRLPKEITAWAKEQKADAELLTAARAAVDGALESDLAELWDEGDEGDIWRGHIAALKARIA